jgi:hypothetical protein
MAVKTLWVQEMVLKGWLLVTKIGTSENVADIGTKPLTAAQYQKLRGLLGLVLVGAAVGEEMFEETVGHNTVVAVQVVEGASGCIAGVILGLLLAVGAWLLFAPVGATKREDKKFERSVGTQTEDDESDEDEADKDTLNEKGGKKQFRDMCCQAPCTYTFRRSTPRFLPLGPGLEGAWIQDGSVR